MERFHTDSKKMFISELINLMSYMNIPCLAIVIFVKKKSKTSLNN